MYADQLARVAATEHPGRFRLLVAAESAGALVAAEMGAAGLPWRADVHDEVLHELLGRARPRSAARRAGWPSWPPRIARRFGVRGLHPDSPAEVLKAFARAGVELPNTRAWVLRGVDHPAVPLLLEYKELYRIWTAHGWAWLEQWVRDGRFRPEYVPGGVVSGRWATRGGGALQIPKVIRRAVVADPGWRLVVADAGQLEPRVLAAVSGDARLGGGGRRRRPLRGAGRRRVRRRPGQGQGRPARRDVRADRRRRGPALAVLRRRYPTAFGVRRGGGPYR